MMPVFEAEICRQGEVVRTRFSGVVTAAHMVGAVLDFEKLLPRVRPGFSILADLSAVDSMELECAPHMSRIMDLCKARGVGAVIRVIPDPSKDIGLNILSIIHYGTGVRILTCRTLEEGESALK
jgi:hypothetical protein